MSGAVALTGMSAVSSGAGLVTLAVPDRCLETVAGFDPCYMTVPISDNEVGHMLSSETESILEMTKSATSVAMGPGLGQSNDIRQIVGRLYRDCPRPMVVDADGLNALAKGKVALSEFAGPRILTPHIGEFRRLVGQPELTVEACRAEAARLAEKHKLVIVLKGRRSLVTNGTDRHENLTGNPGMATGGSGDVLTGVIVALIGQGYSTMDAAVLGTHVHGLAGDLGSQAYGQISLTARKLVDRLAPAFQSLA